MYTSDNIVMIYGVLCFVEVGGGVIKAWKKPKRAIIFASWELPISWTRKASVRRTDIRGWTKLELDSSYENSLNISLHILSLSPQLTDLKCALLQLLRRINVNSKFLFICRWSIVHDIHGFYFSCHFFASNFRALSLAKLLSKLAIFRRQPTVIFKSRCSSHNTTVLVNGYCFIIDKAYLAWIACNCRDWELLKHQCSLGFWHSHIQETPRGRVISQSGSNTCRLLPLSNMQ